MTLAKEIEGARRDFKIAAARLRVLVERAGIETEMDVLLTRAEMWELVKMQSLLLYGREIHVGAEGKRWEFWLKPDDCTAFRAIAPREIGVERETEKACYSPAVAEGVP